MFLPNEIEMDDEEFELLRSLVYDETGVALRNTKRSLLKSRLVKRLRELQIRSYRQYYDYLKLHDRDGVERQAMINAVTTHKTSFFREPHHFEILRDHILLPAKEAAARGYAPSLRIWSAGCSSGEEPYTMAITIANTFENLAAWDVKVLATDIDTEMLDTAYQGMYARDGVSDVSRSDLKTYFLSGTGRFAEHVQVKPVLRDLIRFARLNLMDEPWPFTRQFDAIFCRNVIIYFDQDIQRRVLERFAHCLRPGGLLFAGHSENLFWLGDLFEPIGQTVYRVRPRETDSSESRPN